MKQILPDKVYDVLKWIAIIALDAFAKFYASIAARWGLPYADEISGTLQDIGILLGALLCISTISYLSNKPEEPHAEDKLPEEPEFHNNVEETR